MQIKKLLDDRPVMKGDRLFDSKGEPFEFVEVSGEQVTIVGGTHKTMRKPPAELGCYLIDQNRTNKGIAKERLRSFWED